MKVLSSLTAILFTVLLISACSQAPDSPVVPAATQAPAKAVASTPTQASAAPVASSPTQAPAKATSPAATDVSYPTKPINAIVAYPAGGDTDMGARVVTTIAEKKLGQPIQVVNKGGAAGQVGWTELSQQKPDGYTFGFVNQPTLVTTLLDSERKVAFTFDSFDYLINQVDDPVVPYVRADSPYKTLKDLIDDAKKRPGEITLTTTGFRTNEHFGILKLQQAAGVQFRIVHLDGSAQTYKDLLGGHIDVGVDNIGGWVQRVKDGEVRALAVMSKERSKFMPDVQTTAEAGYPTALMSSSRGVIAPKGIPAAVSSKLIAGLKAAMEDAEHVDKMENLGLTVKMIVGDEYVKYTKDLLENAKELMILAGKESK